MANTAAQELGKKGGQAKSEKKTLAARENAKKPRKPMPEFQTKQLINLAWLELKTERDRCAVVGERYDGLKINGHDLIDILAHHLKTL